MIIYNYDPDGYYCGQSLADKSPLEPGVFLIPARATDKESPIPRENQLVKFVSGAWTLEDIPVTEYEPELEQSNETEIITPPVDQNGADLWEAILDLSAQIEAIKGGH